MSYIAIYGLRLYTCAVRKGGTHICNLASYSPTADPSFLSIDLKNLSYQNSCVIPTSYFIFNDFYTCIAIRTAVQLKN